MSISPDQIHLSAEQRRQLADLAERLNRSWEDVFVEALEYLGIRHQAPASNGDESFYDAAMRRQLIGCVEGGPADLSTNPKYMEGFGESGS